MRSTERAAPGVRDVEAPGTEDRDEGALRRDDGLFDGVDVGLPPRPSPPPDATGRHGFSPALTRSPRMLRVFDAIRSVAGTDATVLLRGEPGTGAELAARAIHERSRRAGRPLVGVSCGAFPGAALDAELFGREKGDRGAFDLATGGSLFLDEVGEASPSAQVGLLRALEEGRFRRLGRAQTVAADVRVIAATGRDLEADVAAGRFREDLLYRLDVFPITLPALRDRPEDIPLLLRHFLDDAARAYDLPAPDVGAEAEARIARYRWPGNVRQLRALCERWVIRCAGGRLLPEHLPFEAGEPDAAAPSLADVDDTVPLATLLERVAAPLERAYLHKLLTRFGGHLQNTASAAGITRRTLYSRMKALGLDARDYK